MQNLQNSAELTPGNMKKGVSSSCVKPKRIQKEIKYRSYVFTWFNAAEQDVCKFIAFCEERELKYMLGNEICPTTGKQHWQGYVEGKNAWRKKTLQDLIGNSWCESAAGSQYSQWKYITKEGREFKTNFEIDKINKSGREDLLETLEFRMKSNQFYLDDQRDFGHDHDAAEYGKYMNMKHKYIILT